MGIKFCQFTCLKIDKLIKIFASESILVHLINFLAVRVFQMKIFYHISKTTQLFGPIISPINNKHLLSEVKLQSWLEKWSFNPALTLVVFPYLTFIDAIRDPLYGFLNTSTDDIFLKF